MYAVYAVDGTVRKTTYASWDECRRQVEGHRAVFRRVEGAEGAAVYFGQMESAKAAGQPFLQGAGKPAVLPAKKPAVPTDGQLEVRFSFSLFYNERSGYCVYSYLLTDGRRVTVKGYYLPSAKGITYIMHGRYVKDPKYGLQFDASSFEEKVDTSRSGIVAYLSSGIIKGIGEKTAARIYDQFGEKSLEVLEQEPDKLLAVKGITKRKLEGIVKSYTEKKGAQAVIRYLMPFNIPPSLGAKVYRAGISVEDIRRSPYTLCAVRGISFPMADAAARKQGVSLHDPERMEACARYVLTEHEYTTGSLCMDKDLFGSCVKQALNSPDVTNEEILEATCGMIRAKKLVYRKMAWYDGSERCLLILPERFRMEQEAARIFVQISSQKAPTHEDLDRHIESEAARRGIRLDPLQETAVRTVVTSMCCVITGGPGTGKTTIQELVTNYLSRAEPDREVICIAPTGMAARRLTESCGIPASTVHSLLGLRAGVSQDLLDSATDEKMDKKTIILDEASMVDIYLFYMLLRAIGDGCRLVIVGDAGQLPSVGPGAVLRDIIQSGLVPVVRLSNVFRQAKGSEIYEATRRINSGQTNIISGSEFTIYEMSGLSEIQRQMCALYKQRVAQYGRDNVFVLCPYRKHDAGTVQMNRLLQMENNPPAPGKNELEHHGQIFRTGDRVMNTVNGAEVVNGDIGTVEDAGVKDDEPYVTVRFFNDLLVEYTGEQLDNITLAYAMTVHKAQGSEAACVITCLTRFHRTFLFRNFPNTAISRGKQHVDFLGEKQALERAVQTPFVDRRLSLFWSCLALYSGWFAPI